MYTFDHRKGVLAAALAVVGLVGLPTVFLPLGRDQGVFARRRADGQRRRRLVRKRLGHQGRR